MDNLDFAKNLIGSHDYVWVPIVALAAITIIAGLIGFWNGWKTSLYFFGWNLVGTIVGVFVVSPIMKALDAIGILKVVSGSAEAMWGMLIIFVLLLSVNFIAFLSYWIFRSKLKKSMKLNKKAGKSNLSSRFIGMGIAITSASPAAFFLADATAVMSEENGFTKFTDAVARAYTGGKYDGTNEDRETISSLTNSMDAITAFADALGNPGTSGSDLFKHKDDIQKILNTNFAKNIDTIYDGIKNSGISGMQDADLGNVKADDITNNVPAMGIKFEGNKEQEFKKAVSNLFMNNGKSSDDAKKIAEALIAKLTA